MRSAVLLAAALLLTQSGWAAKAKKKRPRRAPAPVLTVTPSPEIEARIAEEVARAESILNDLRPDNALDSPYLISAVYYHDGIFDRFAKDRAEADPADRVVAHICDLLTPERKRAFIEVLRAMSPAPAFDEQPRFALPVPWSEPQTKRGRRRWRAQNHKNAIDLFAKEGSPVYAAAGGVVVLSESGWSATEPFSASSLRGGNAVIIFNGAENRFYRYCHLEAALVETGTALDAGSQIGVVGHTGFNASRPGHGGHLHFEINEFDGATVRALSDKQLRDWLSKSANAR